MKPQDKLFKDLIDTQARIIACQELIELFETSKLLNFETRRKLVDGCLIQIKDLVKDREVVINEIRLLE